MDGLDFLTVAGNFLDAYSRARHEDMNFRRQAAREDQLTAAERQYQTGVREGEHAFQAAQADAARGFQRSESDREYARGATARALQEEQARLQLGMTRAQFDEWKATAPGRAHMAELEGRKAEAELGLIGAQTQHYRALGAGGGGGSGRVNPNAVTPGERWQDDLDKKAAMYFRMTKVTDPDGNPLPEEQIQANMDMAYRLAMQHMPPKPGDDGSAAPAVDPNAPPPYVPGSRPFIPPENPEYDAASKAFNPEKYRATVDIVNEDARKTAGHVYNMSGPYPVGSGMQGPQSGPYGEILRSYQDEFAKRAKIYSKKDPMYQGNKTDAQKRADAYGQ